MARVERYTPIYKLEYIKDTSTGEIMIKAGSIEEAIEIFKIGYNHTIVSCALFLNDVLCSIEIK